MSRWYYNRIKQSPKYYARVQMLAFKLWIGRVHSKTLKVFFSLQQILFLEIFKLTHSLKTVHKSFLENFEINMKIN